MENQSLGRKNGINFQTVLGKYGDLSKNKGGKTSGRRNCPVTSKKLPEPVPQLPKNSVRVINQCEF
jgi:hypothetical protein